MLAFAYLIPLLACLVLNLGFHYTGEWKVYLWIVLAGEAVVGLLHVIFHYARTHTKEYLGSLVADITYEAPWTEIQHYTVTRKDSRGNTYTTVQTRYIYHPERYHFNTTRGSNISTDSDFFNYVIARWGVEPTTVRWTSPRIRGGVRYGENAEMPAVAGQPYADDTRRISVTETHKYRNPIRNSNSIFKFPRIPRKRAEELGLYDYPEILRHDMPCVLSNDVLIDFEVREKFRRFNGFHAPAAQMRLFILVFPAEKGVAITEYQRAYWQGGNKNEMTICIGVNPDDTVEWARAFSWADNKQLEVEAADWLLTHRQLDLDAFHDWLADNYWRWERKQFSDFKYISVSLSLWQILTIYGMSILENALAIKIALAH